jgi:geranylgeranyl pyrophosphate synthase
MICIHTHKTATLCCRWLSRVVPFWSGATPEGLKLVKYLRSILDRLSVADDILDVTASSEELGRKDEETDEYLPVLGLGGSGKPRDW